MAKVSMDMKIRFKQLSALCLLVLVLASGCMQAESRRENVTQSRSGKVSDEEVALYGLYSMFGGGNPHRTPDGGQIVEGDIAVAGSQDPLKARKATPDASVYWPRGEVIYTYHESINPAERAVIEAAMQHWQQHTCITFRPRQAGDYYFVRFRSDTQGCWSLVGRQADRAGQGQDVSIGAGCANLNVVVHEIGHVIGFYHEQSRSDRDEYIDIVWTNVLPGYALQFRKENDASFNIPYDLTSTMQYPQWAFSKEIFEKSTIVARNPAYQRFLSKNYPLSFRDRLLANKLYQCTGVCGSNSCSNGGYMRSTSTERCTCDCPPNFTGANCESQLRPDYYENLPCGGIVTRRGKIQTPSYPVRTAPFQSCMWDIRAPAGSLVRIKFDGFEFAPRFTKPGTKVINKCFNETVEFRLRSANMYDGDTYCGTDISTGASLYSDGPRAVIIITANDKMVGKGMSASISFVRRKPNVGNGEEGEEEITEDGDPERGKKPQPEISATTESPTQTGSPQPPTGIFTLPPLVGTLPPILPPRPPPTPNSLLEEYERESKITFPPVMPFIG